MWGTKSTWRLTLVQFGTSQCGLPHPPMYIMHHVSKHWQTLFLSLSYSIFLQTLPISSLYHSTEGTGFDCSNNSMNWMIHQTPLVISRAGWNMALCRTYFELRCFNQAELQQLKRAGHCHCWWWPYFWQEGTRIVPYESVPVNEIVSTWHYAHE